MVPNAVDVESFQEIADCRRVPVEPFQIGFIGRLDPIKRVEDLVASMNGWHPGGAHLHVFGEGPQRSHIENEIRRLGCPGRSHCTAVTRPHEVLASLDVLVLPSDAEGFGLVLIEAMAAGVPVVAQRVPGIEDVRDNPTTGMPSRQGPRPPLRRHDVGLPNREWRKSSMAAARADVQRRFSWEAALRQYRLLLRIGR